MLLDEQQDQFTYTVEMVEALLGLREAPGRHGHRDVTIADIMSWRADPGGDGTWYRLVHQEVAAWMARRGPLAAHSETAAILYDFERAMKRLPLSDQAIVALTVMGFTVQDIARVLDLSREEPSGRDLDARRKRVARVLEGRAMRDADGNEVHDELGDVRRIGGIAVRMMRHMNGGG